MEVPKSHLHFKSGDKFIPKTKPFKTNTGAISFIKFGVERGLLFLAFVTDFGNIIKLTEKELSDSYDLLLQNSSVSLSEELFYKLTRLKEIKKKLEKSDG